MVVLQELARMVMVAVPLNHNNQAILELMDLVMLVVGILMFLLFTAAAPVVEQVQPELQQIPQRLYIQAVMVNNTVSLVHKFIMPVEALELHITAATELLFNQALVVKVAVDKVAAHNHKTMALQTVAVEVLVVEGLTQAIMVVMAALVSLS